VNARVPASPAPVEPAEPVVDASVDTVVPVEPDVPVGPAVAPVRVTSIRRAYGSPESSIPEATSACVPAASPVGIVTVAVKVPSAPATAVPSGVGVEYMVRTTVEKGRKPLPVRTTSSPGVTWSTEPSSVLSGPAPIGAVAGRCGPGTTSVTIGVVSAPV
jgi:hypothetical protein